MAAARATLTASAGDTRPFAYLHLIRSARAARSVELAAAKALDEHRRAHGC
jgi:hypothetical protein